MLLLQVTESRFGSWNRIWWHFGILIAGRGWEDFIMRLYRVTLFCFVLLCLVAPARAETWALLIGVDSYDSSDIRPLKGAVNDTLALKEALIVSKICTASNITVLATGIPGSKPDRGAILAEVESLNNRIQAGDTVLVFYSGHGCQDGAKTYLLSADVRSKTIPLVKKTAVDVEDFEDALRRLPTAQVIITYDMCRVEIGKDGLPKPVTKTMQGKGQDFGELVASADKTPLVKPSELKHSVLVRWWSCSPGERSFEVERKVKDVTKWRGYFSEAIERGIRGEAMTDGVVTLAGLEKYVRESVIESVKRQQTETQHPRLLLDVGGLEDVYSFVLGRGVPLSDRVVFDPGTPVDLKARLTVIVTNAAGEIVPDAIVTIDGRETKSGSYNESLPDSATKKVRVVVKASGYEPGGTDVVIERSVIKKVTLTLEPSEFNNLPLIFTPTGAKEVLILKVPGGLAWSASFSPDGRRIITGGSDDTARVWDANTGQVTLTLKGHWHAVTSASFSPNGRRILTGSWDNTAKVWDAGTGKVMLTLKGNISGGINSAMFSPDGRRILTASYDKTTRVWDANTGKVMLTLKGHTDSVVSAVFAPDGKKIVTASDDKTAKVWDANTGKVILTLKGHTDRVSLASFTPDGKRILTGSYDKTAKIWNANTGQEILTLKGDEYSFWSAAFSPDGRHIFTGSGINIAKIWDSNTGKEITKLFGQTGPAKTVAFSPDGRRIVTAGDRVGIWQLE